MLGPDSERLDQRVLYGVLGRGEVLPAPHQLGQHLGCKGPDDVIDVVRSPISPHYQAITSRTSIHS